jgi:hypothetical protein
MDEATKSQAEHRLSYVRSWSSERLDGGGAGSRIRWPGPNPTAGPGFGTGFGAGPGPGPGNLNWSRISKSRC